LLTIFRVVSIVAVDKTGGSQATFLGREENAIHCSKEAGIIRRNEEDQRSNQDRGVKMVSTLIALNEASEVRAITLRALAHNVRMKERHTPAVMIFS
jgi:hypothetical protein